MVMALGLALTAGAALAQDSVGQGASGVGTKAVPRPAPSNDDTQGTTDANADAARNADAQTRRIVDKQAEYKAKVDKSISDYDAKMEAYRAQVRPNEARNAEIERRNAARAALYKACVAGDKGACARYNAGQ